MKLNFKLCIGIIAIIGCFNAALSQTVLSNAAETTSQSEEELERIKARNEEYDRTHPRPTTSPKRLKVSITDTSTDGKALSIKNQSFNAPHCLPGTGQQHLPYGGL